MSIKDKAIEMLQDVVTRTLRVASTLTLLDKRRLEKGSKVVDPHFGWEMVVKEVDGEKVTLEVDLNYIDFLKILWKKSRDS